MKKNQKQVLLVCPWLSLDGAVGSFFREQAEIIADEYEPIFIKFEMHGLKSILNNRFLVNIKEEKTKENRTVFTLYYPRIRLISQKMNTFLLEKSIHFLFKQFKQRGIAIKLIHCHSVMNVGHWALLMHKLTGLPYINTEHNQVSFINKSNDSVNKIKEALEKAKYNLAISSDKIRQFAANRLFPEFIFIGNMINPIFKYKAKELNNTFKIITIGAFDPIKDHKTMFSALVLLDKKIKEKIIFEWIGSNGWSDNQDKPTYEFLKSFSFNNIEMQLSPYLEREDIVLKLQEAHLFLFSSISEGMPVSVLEALACGTPVVTTNCGGVDNVVDEINGHIVPVADFKQLADKAYKQYINRKNIDHKLISNNILSKFGSDVFKQNILAIYNASL